MRIDEDGEEVQESGILEVAGACQCPRFVAESARTRNITCQRLFERAFCNLGYEPSFARAIFAVFTNQSLADAPNLVPSLVREYAEYTRHSSLDKTLSSRGKCMGCMLTPEARQSWTNGYERVWPQVNRELLFLASQSTELMNNSLGTHRLLTPAEIAWNTLVESGGLEESDDLHDLMRFDDDS